ncbi:protein naked cuticle homolog 1 isoform X1 [Phyllostomus discolor]|uniref:Protein naked cuticle homolog n=1 Tax=Phyllostomus discolor TaxID=89673 RepID=A0A7E6CRB3_9CHIR|nr:protein naked cuticle homolog 1 isoform X1 [Phyllostomus discolor]
MGKLHSKPAAVCKRRESPEGDSFAVSAAWARKGIEEWIGRQRCPGGSSGPRQLRAAGTAGRGARMPEGSLCSKGGRQAARKFDEVTPSAFRCWRKMGRAQARLEPAGPCGARR